jgi:hypothetical protein
VTVLEIKDSSGDLLPYPSSNQISILSRANSAQRRFRRVSRRSSIGPTTKKRNAIDCSFRRAITTVTNAQSFAARARINAHQLHRCSFVPETNKQHVG